VWSQPPHLKTTRPASTPADQRTSEARMGSVIKKRRKKIRKHKFKKLRKKMRFSRR
jgi:hypothetical protein